MEYLEEIELVNRTLRKLGIDRQYMQRVLPERNPKHSLDAIIVLFTLVHFETNFGERELPALSNYFADVFLTSVAVQRGVEGQVGGPNNMLQEAMSKYSQDLQFRAELYVTYRDYFLPASENT